MENFPNLETVKKVLLGLNKGRFTISRIDAPDAKYDFISLEIETQEGRVLVANEYGFKIVYATIMQGKIRGFYSLDREDVDTFQIYVDRYESKQ